MGYKYNIYFTFECMDNVTLQGPSIMKNIHSVLIILLVLIICASCANVKKYVKNAIEFTNEVGEWEEFTTATEFDPDPCFSYPCMNNGKCVNYFGRYKCYCERNYTGDDCSIAPNPCCPNPCQNGGYCMKYFRNDYTCSCKNGYIGDTCETVDHCASRPCQNGGSCRNGNNTFECMCTINYEGEDCSQSIWCNKYGQQLCNQEKCLYNEVLRRGYCVCENGTVFHEPSRTCTIDYCASNPCQNGGTCRNGENNFECTCTEIYGGQDCSENKWCYKYGKDLCGKEICQYNEDIRSGYCVCKDGEVFYAPSKTCMARRCTTHHCQNGGVCKDDGDGPTCYCKSPFSGERCEKVPDPCLPNPCKNNGQCAYLDGKAKCFCKYGYSGSKCETVLDPCWPNPCKNNGQCVNADGNAKCFCKYGYSGSKCETGLDPCYPNPCKNTGHCENENGNYKCFCKNGYFGNECEREPDSCYPNPCKNSGQCVIADRKSMCLCKYGYSGAECEIDYRYMIASVLLIVLFAAICLCSGCCLFRMTHNFLGRDLAGYKSVPSLT